MGGACSGRCAAAASTTSWWSGNAASRSTRGSRPPAGHSHYINGPAGLAHLHRLRALVDAVVIGVGTAIADDPQLTVRRVAGPSPARVVIDPNGRLPPTARVLAADGVAPAGGDRRPGTRRGAAGRHRGRARCPQRTGRSRRPRSWPRSPSAACAASWSRAAPTRSRASSPRAASTGCMSWWRRSSSAAGRRASRCAPIERVDAGAPCADARPYPRRGSAARLRSVGSARAGRPGKHVDVTDASVRAALRQMSARRRASQSAISRRGHLRGHRAPTSAKLASSVVLDFAIVRAEHPIGAALHDRIADTLEALDARAPARPARAPDRSPCRCAGAR